MIDDWKYRIRRVFVAMVFCLVASACLAQVSPPGLDGAKAVAWTAIGFNQRFSHKWSTTIYAGGSGQSDPDKFAPFQKAAIFVLNQETLYNFSSRWQLAACTSLRYQELYTDSEPYSPQDPSWRKEIRYYLRLFYRPTPRFAAWSFSFRPEYRTFYGLHGDRWTVPAQWRFRLKGQVNLPLDKGKMNFFIAANEWLAATDQRQSQWSAFVFTEDRLSTFWRHVIRKPHVFVDLGLMHQFWMNKERRLNYTTYLSLDLLFQNPFGGR